MYADRVRQVLDCDHADLHPAGAPTGVASTELLHVVYCFSSLFRFFRCLLAFLIPGRWFVGDAFLNLALG